MAPGSKMAAFVQWHNARRIGAAVEGTYTRNINQLLSRLGNLHFGPTIKLAIMFFEPQSFGATGGLVEWDGGTRILDSSHGLSPSCFGRTLSQHVHATTRWTRILP